jgi:hypothetical protein
MHAGNYHVHLGEYVVGKIEVAVGEDVDFDSSENRDVLDAVVCVADFLYMSYGARVIEAVGEG